MLSINWIAVIIISIFIWIVSEIIEKMELNPTVSYYIGIIVALAGLFLSALIDKV